MTLRWLSSMVGGRRVKSVRRKVAPEAQHALGAAIDADAVEVQRVLLRELVLDPDERDEAERTVLVRVDAQSHPALEIWLNVDDSTSVVLHVRTDWLFLPAVPEAILMVVAEEPTTGAPRFRFNLRFDADLYRRHLDTLNKTGLLGLTTVPLQISDERYLESPCIFVDVPRGALSEFLREIPAAPVV